MDYKSHHALPSTPPPHFTHRLCVKSHTLLSIYLFWMRNYFTTAKKKAMFYIVGLSRTKITGGQALPNGGHTISLINLQKQGMKPNINIKRTLNLLPLRVRSLSEASWTNWAFGLWRIERLWSIKTVCREENEFSQVAVEVLKVREYDWAQ